MHSMFYRKNNPPPKGATVDTTNLTQEEILHMDPDLYNVTIIRGFTSILTVVFAKITMLWILPTESKNPQSELFDSS